MRWCSAKGWRFGFRRSVGTGVGGGEVNFCFGVVIDCLTAAHRQGKVALHLEIMSHGGELLPNFGRHAVFDKNFASQIEVAAHRETRGLQGGLKVMP